MKKIFLCTATLVAPKVVIPAKAGIQASSLRKQGTSILTTGFPRIKYPVSSTGQAKASLVKPGMTSCTGLMSLCIITFSVVILFHLFFHSVAFCATGQAVLNEIQSRYEKTNDFEANFIQEYIGKVMRQSDKGEGKVYFKKKGMMRWDYTVPNQKLISDGHNLWYYQPEEKQVLVSNISTVLKEKTPLAFLAGEGSLNRDFNLLNLNESVSQKEDNYVIELAPKEPLATLSKLTLTVDKKTYIVLQADVFDGMGNVTRTRFVDVKTNVGLSNSIFQFTIPPGTEVIKMQEPSTPAPGGKRPGKK